MPEQLGFETMLIIDPWGMAFHAVGVIGLTFDFLFKMVSSYCVELRNHQFIQALKFAQNPEFRP